MTTTNTYTLNSTTAHDLKEGDTLDHTWLVTTILPCGRGYRITVIDLRDHRPLYLERLSTFYGTEVTHTEETPDPAPETDPSDDVEPQTTYAITSPDEVTTYTERRTAYNALREILEASDDAHEAFEEWVTTNHEALGTPLDLSDENFVAWCEFASDALLCSAEERGSEDFYDLTITATTDYVSAPSAPVEETAATTPEAPRSYIVDEVQEFEYTGGGIWVTCGYVRDTITEERFFFDGNLGENYVEYLTVYSEYPYYPDEEDVAGCSFQPLPNFDELFRDGFDPEDEAGRDLWRRVIEAGAPSVYRSTFLSALEQYAPRASTLTPDTSVTTTRYSCGGGFFCDIEEYGDRFEAWLGHRDYGIRSLMFGAPKSNAYHTKPNTETLDSFRELVEANLPEYIDSFRDEHMDE